MGGGKKVYRGFAERAKYTRSINEAECEHILEAHVRYDLQASGYRAQLRCRCTKVTIDGRKVRYTCKQAEEDGKVMMQVAEAHMAAQIRGNAADAAS